MGAITLDETTHEHHDRLAPGVRELLDIAEQVGATPCDELRPRVVAARGFLEETLIPHMEQAESALYPTLEQLLGDPRAMAPMRREHVEIRGLVQALGTLCDHRAATPYTPGDAMKLRRILFRLYGLLRVHLFEEQEYVTLLRGNITQTEASALARNLEHAWRVAL